MSSQKGKRQFEQKVTKVTKGGGIWGLRGGSCLVVPSFLRLRRGLKGKMSAQKGKRQFEQKVTKVAKGE
jgi:hypothetical protein